MISESKKLSVLDLEYYEPLFIKLKDDFPNHFRGMSTKTNKELMGETIKVHRTGSHTVQLIKPYKGFYGNWKDEDIENIYLREEYPELFI